MENKVYGRSSIAGFEALYKLSDGIKRTAERLFDQQRYTPLGGGECRFDANGLRRRDADCVEPFFAQHFKRIGICFAAGRLRHRIGSRRIRIAHRDEFATRVGGIDPRVQVSDHSYADHGGAQL